MTRRASRGRGVATLAVLGLWATCAAVAADADVQPPSADRHQAMRLLERMVQALASRAYEGTLVYLHGKHLAALRVARQFDAGEARESLLTLDGPLRAVARTAKGVACLLSGAHPILMDRSPAASLGAYHFDWAALTDHYDLRTLEATRVAGRATDVVAIIPRDTLRYGYRFYVDRDSGLPLKTELTDWRAEPIEQVMFTDFHLLPRASSVPPPSDDSSTTPVEAARSKPRLTPPDAVTDSSWTFDPLPPGFVPRAHARHAGGTDNEYEHFLFGDGLASVSVYIETAVAPGLEGDTRMGAIHAAGRRIADHQVTVVGEVPAPTVNWLLEHIRPGAADARTAEGEHSHD